MIDGGIGLVKALKTQRWATTLIGLALVVGAINYLINGLHYTTFDIGPAPDQIRDAVIYQEMLRGQLPTLGPGSSVGGYQLPPLYYYLVAPAAVLGADPMFTVWPNALLSFASIPVFIGVIYLLLVDLSMERRWMLAAVAGLWYALLYPLVFISTFQWNPSPIPFFVFCAALMYRALFRAQMSFVLQAVIWAAYGVVMAVLVCLHSATLFVMPAIYLGSLIAYWIRHRKRLSLWGLPFLSVASALLALLPYWYGELGRRLGNTKQIIRAVLGSDDDAQSGSGIAGRLGRIVWNYAELGWQSYFIGNGWPYRIIAVVFGVSVLGLGLWAIAKTFKGDRVLLNFLLAIWAVYLLAASSYTDAYVIHYKLLILIAPIVLAVVTLAYCPLKGILGRAVRTAVSAGIVASMVSNLIYDGAYFASRFGPQRLMTSKDVVEIVRSLPAGATLCDPRYVRWRQQHHIADYIDQYITQQGLELSQTCPAGSYLIDPKRVYLFTPTNVWPAFQTRQQSPLDQTVDTEVTLVNETTTARLYQFETAAALDECYSFVGDRYLDDSCPNLL
ncbi:MAG: hypothetical protein AAGF66_16685 [Cyanobacteria bacterium P01_H01_bin.119]